MLEKEIWGEVDGLLSPPDEPHAEKFWPAVPAESRVGSQPCSSVLTLPEHFSLMAFGAFVFI